MKKQYYRLNKTESNKLHKQWLTLRKEPSDIFDKARAEFDKKHKNDDFYAGPGFCGTFDIAALLFRSKDNIKKHHSVKEEMIDGSKFYVAIGNKRFKAGKELNKEIANLNKLYTNIPVFSHWVLEQYFPAFSVGVTEGKRRYYSSAGIAKGYLVLQIILDDGSTSELVDPFERIKKSQFVALTEE